jgi:hypothetical protein
MYQTFAMTERKVLASHKSFACCKSTADMHFMTKSNQSKQCQIISCDIFFSSITEVLFNWWVKVFF